MQASDIPVKFSIPFANGAAGGYVRTIPVSSQIGIQDGAASLTDGFPPLTFLAEGSGGIPPFGQDFNGILKEITQWTRWLNAGGMVKYDGTFSAAIGGYPQGALILNAAGTGFWLCTVDNNTNNPDTTPTGWTSIISTPSGAQPLFEGTATPGTATPYAREDHVHPNDSGGAASGTANAIIIAKPNGLAALVDGVTLSFFVTTNNSGATTLQVGTGGGALGPLAMQRDSIAGPVALAGAELIAGNVAKVQVRSGAFHLLNPAVGTAAAADSTSRTGKVNAMFGPAVIGNLPVFNDTTGTLVDSNVSPGSLSSSANNLAYILGLIF